MIRFIVLALALLSLSACGGPAPSPTPDAGATATASAVAAQAQQTEVARQVSQALTAAAPTITPTPTVTPTPTATSTPTSSPTPTETPTPVPTDTPKPVPTATPKPTPVPPLPKSSKATFDNAWSVEFLNYFHAPNIYYGSERRVAFGKFVTFMLRINNLQRGTDFYLNRYTWWIDDGLGNQKRYAGDLKTELAAQYYYCGCGNSFGDVAPGGESVLTVTFDVDAAAKTLLFYVAAQGTGGKPDRLIQPAFIVPDADAPRTK